MSRELSEVREGPIQTSGGKAVQAEGRAKITAPRQACAWYVGEMTRRLAGWSLASAGDSRGK